MNYVIWLSYDGTRYGGWQKQRNTDRTIQGEPERMFKRLDEVPAEVRGFGRTGADVHALAQVVDFRLDRGVAPKGVMKYLSRYPPEDIGVWKTEKTSERFHGHLSAMRKTYRYQVETRPKKDVFQRRYYYRLGLELDTKAMGQVADLPTGTRDFKSFCGSKKMKKSTVCTLGSTQFECIRDTKSHISLAENGLLQQMVRVLTGTLIEMGPGERQPDDTSWILETKDRQKAGFATPSQGLLLEKVKYGELR